MQRIFVTVLPACVGQRLPICGLVEVVRDQKRMQFVIVRDVTGAVQVVHDKKSGDPMVTSTISNLTVGSAVCVTGTVVTNAEAKLGGIEMQVDKFEVVGPAHSPLPIMGDSSAELQMDWRHISLRSPENLLIFKVQTTMEQAMREFWGQHGFLEIHSPKLMGTASESGAELFELPYFGRTAYLAQSPQFYKQMAMAAGLDRVFEIGPVFRANPSFTSRHDTEFTSVDMEISWITSHEDVMALEEQWLAFVLGRVALIHGDEIRDLFGVEVIVPKMPFPRITLEAARAILSAGGHEIPHKADLDPEGERRLAAHIMEKFGHEFVFVTDYPAEVRAFYHMRYDDRPDVTKSFDLLWKGIEVTTGAQREHRPDRLKQQAIAKGYNLEPLSTYFAFFEYGCPPHGGAGIGLTRLLMMLLGRKNVREVTFLYRGPNRLSP
ncbi:aspartate--tRNA(Asn) ligase [Patescibacteria group bacterium]|nr:aspartate--tRNA(Asn) ligase [Patescibacteria group bacterium]